MTALKRLILVSTLFVLGADLIACQSNKDCSNRGQGICRRKQFSSTKDCF